MNNTNEELEIDLLQLIQALWRKAWLIILVTVIFGFVKDTFGWPAIFVIIGLLYVVLLVLTLVARKMKTKNV